MREKKIKKIESVGLVNFPIDDPEYFDTGEGGMVVRLVIEIDDKDYQPIKYGGENYVISDLTYIGDDNRPLPNYTEVENAETVEEFYSYLEKEKEYIKYHFPRHEKEFSRCFDCVDYKFLSKPYLGVITLGGTNWSGWSDIKKEYFICKKENLTEEGKKLYELLETLFPDAKLTIQTWLDT